MSTENRFSFTPNVVIGIGIMFLGAVLMLERFGVVDARSLLQLWPVLLILFGASIVMQALWGDPEASARAGHERVGGFWIFLVIVALVSWQAQRRGDISATDTDAEAVSLFAVMGGDHRTSLAPQFRGGEMTSIMGQTRLDLRQATIAPGEEAVIDIFAIMGGAVVHVPPDWIVDVRTVPVMGGVRDERGRPPEDPDDEGLTPRERRRARRALPMDDDRGTLQPLEPPIEGGPPARVVLRGFILMGGLTIRS